MDRLEQLEKENAELRSKLDGVAVARELRDVCSRMGARPGQIEPLLKQMGEVKIVKTSRGDLVMVGDKDLETAVTEIQRAGDNDHLFNLPPLKSERTEHGTGTMADSAASERARQATAQQPKVDAQGRRIVTKSDLLHGRVDPRDIIDKKVVVAVE